MTPTEALVEYVVLVIFRVLLVAFALACASLAFLTLRQKRGSENSTELTMEKGGYKIQIVRVGPFIAFMAMAAFGLYEACNAQFPRLMVPEPTARQAPQAPQAPQVPQSPQLAQAPQVIQVPQVVHVPQITPVTQMALYQPFFLYPVPMPSGVHIPPTTLPVHEGESPLTLPRSR